MDGGTGHVDGIECLTVEAQGSGVEDQENGIVGRVHGASDTACSLDLTVAFRLPPTNSTSSGPRDTDAN